MKIPGSSFFWLVLFLFVSFSSVFAQKFEGTLTYNIHYIPKSDVVKIKDLEAQYGNKEIVSIKNGNYKSERFYNDIVLKTTFFDYANRLNFIQSNRNDYWTKCHAGSDFAKKRVKLDTSATIGSYACEVFRYAKTALKVTFFISKEKYATTDTSSNWFTYPSTFKGPVIKMVVETPDYILVQELTSADAKSIDNKTFETNNTVIVIPQDDISNTILEPAKRRELLQCMYKSIGYPGFLQLNNIEGKVVAEVFIDNNGTIKNTGIRTEYFKKQEESIRIYNTKKVLCLEHKTQKKILPLVQKCLSGYNFKAPVSDGVNVNTIFKIPFVFSKNAADVAEETLDLDEQDIDDSFYDDFEEFY